MSAPLQVGDRITRVTRPTTRESASKPRPVLVHATVVSTENSVWNNPIDEGILWIRGTHASDSIEARALLAAWALVYA